MPPDPPEPAEDQHQSGRNSEEQVLARLFQSESVRFADQLVIPQFGIIHLLFWTTVTAVVLKINLALWGDDPWAARSPLYSWLTKVSIIVGSIVAAGELVGVGALARARCHTMLRRLQPGHWLVLIGGFESILSLVAWGIVRLVLGVDWSSGGKILILVWMPSAAAAVAFVLAAIGLGDARRWKILLAAAGFVVATTAAVLMRSYTLWLFDYRFPSLLEDLSRLAAYSPAFLLVVLVAAVALDLLRHRASRDWVHWLGTISLGVTCLMRIVSQIAATLFPNQ